MGAKRTKPEKIATMWPVIKWEIRSRRWSILWWIIGIAAFVTINLAVYPSFRDQAAELDKTFSQMPQSVRDLFSDTGEFLSPTGYLSSQIFYLMLPMLFSFLTIGLGASLIAREEQRKTIELLLSRPISRGKLLLGKALAGLAVSLVIGLATALICILEVQIIGFEGVSIWGVLAATGLSLLLALLFGAITFTLTSMGAAGRGASIGVAALIAIGSYVISSLDETVKWLQTPAKALPYHYYKPGNILEGIYQPWPIVIFGVIILTLVFVSWIAFRRRDID